MFGMSKYLAIDTLQYKTVRIGGYPIRIINETIAEWRYVNDCPGKLMGNV
ncbi:hypothetical protein CRENPOLYSF2_640029 [Crenothrix polyspora]|uniref:Uncharacterized protein n=1 Tax=Crenothrix polyspora TaxID=360316 RepID=A0A1R4HHA3_9GAMM|nr:hypothetical protein CRENPOLYSF2_640029 [Crenothrix polyspora]